MQTLVLKITPTKILMLSEYKGEFPHHFRSKCYSYIFLNLPSKINLEVILFILIRELVNRTHPKLFFNSPFSDLLLFFYFFVVLWIAKFVFH